MHGMAQWHGMDGMEQTGMGCWVIVPNSIPSRTIHIENHDG
jgi:hypothetical protein